MDAKMAQELNEIERLAKEATPWDWRADGWIVSCDAGVVATCGREYNAAYIAHLHPSRALELVAHIRAVEAELVSERTCRELMDVIVDKLAKQNAALESDRDALEAAKLMPKEDAQ